MFRSEKASILPVLMATIHSKIAAKLNFAGHQSAFAFLRDLWIENDDPEIQLDDVLITLSSDPAFLKPKSWQVDRIAPQGGGINQGQRY